MVTALDQPSDRVRGLEAGADDFLTKPVDDVALIARVRSLARLKVVTRRIAHARRHLARRDEVLFRPFLLSPVGFVHEIYYETYSENRSVAIVYVYGVPYARFRFPSVSQ